MLIQLGAVLAILTVYWGKLVRVVARPRATRPSRRFILSVLVAFLPAAVLGVLLHDIIKDGAVRDARS